MKLTDILNLIIATGLLAVVATWAVGYIQEQILDKQLKELMIQELENNLKVVNENIWEAKESGKETINTYDFYNKVYDSLYISNKIIVLNYEEIQQLAYLHNSINQFRRITSSSQKIKDNYIGTLFIIKIHIRHLFEFLDKKELYESLKLEGTFNKLSSSYIEDYQSSNDKINKIINKPMTQYIFLVIVLIMVAAIFYICKGKNAWDIMFFNTTLAIVVLFMIGLLDGTVWGTVAWTLGLVATGTGVAGIFKVRASK